MKKVVIWGTGRICELFLKIYNPQKVQIVAFIDSDTNKQREKIEGIQIYAPEKIGGFSTDYIIIASAYYSEIKERLMNEKVEEEKVIDFYSVYRRLCPLTNIVWNEILNSEIYQGLITQENRAIEDYEMKELARKKLFLSAKQLISTMPNGRIRSLEEVEFQVYSQFGEDGIIQYLLKHVEIPNKIFVEFGVEDYTEANTRFLLMNNNWSGLVIDGGKDNVDKIEKWELFWKYDLTVVNAFITKDNINQIITEAGFSGDIGLLSIDIDGNDYWVLNAINCVKPRIIICEYNNVYGAEEAVTIPYKEDFYRTSAHYSNLYWGASLKAFCDYADQNGYYYMGSNSAGNNAFFVRKDSVDSYFIPILNEEYVTAKYRESRDETGKLSYLTRKNRLETIKDERLVNLRTGKTEKISDIYYL